MAQENPTKKNILVVDDEHLIVQAFSAFLQTGGYQTFEANDTETAKSILGSERIDMVISDIRMPGENGLSLLDFVSNNFPETMVIMVTGNPDSVVTYSAYAQGAVEFLVKPVSPGQLLGKVNELFAGMSHDTHVEENAQIDSILDSLNKPHAPNSSQEVDDILDSLLDSVDVK